MTLIPGIKQISQVGNDMYIQGAFPVSIATTEVDYLADPADTRLLAGRDPVIEEVSVGMSGSETGIKTASGAAPLHITDAMHGMLRFLETNIKPVQDLHGYANPWPAGGGVNKWDEEWESGAYNSNGEKSPNPDYMRSTNYIPVIADTAYYYKATAGRVCYYESDYTFISRSDPITNTVFTTPSNCAYITFFATGTINNDFAINYPSTVTTYSPYSNICPITGWTGCNVYVSPTSNQADATVYPCIWLDDAGTVYSGTIDLVSGWMEVTHAVYTANGSEQLIAWTLSGSSPNIAATIVLNGGIRYAKYVDGAKNAMCDRLESVSNVEMYQRQKTQGVCVMNDGRIAIQVEGISTLSDMTTWLTANTPQFVYVLETPQYYQVPGNQILTQEGTNYIWTDCGDTITAAYVGKA